VLKLGTCGLNVQELSYSLLVFKDTSLIPDAYFISGRFYFLLVSCSGVRLLTANNINFSKAEGYTD